MKTNIRPDEITPEFKEAVYDLIAKKAHAEKMREAVNTIKTDILTNEVALYNDVEVERHRCKRKRIYNPDRTYLSEDDKSINEYFSACDVAERKAGLKPDDMPRTHCPASVAEHDQRRAEWHLIDVFVELFEINMTGKEYNNLLLLGSSDGKKNGLEFRQEFLNVCINLVLSIT